METVASVCPYCGCGSRLLFIVENGRIVKVLPDRTDNPSEGIACVKGLTVHETMNTGEGRISSPLIRKDEGEPFKEVSWDEAYRFVCQQTKDLAPSEVFSARSLFKSDATGSIFLFSDVFMSKPVLNFASQGAD